MRKILLFLAIAAGLAWPSHAAQMLQAVVADAPQHSTSSYTGPGDILSGATAWWGLRCYNAAKASAAQAIRIRRASDSTETDIGLTAACDLDIATAVTFCLATTCSVKTAYDQTGNSRNATQATAGNQPALTFTCINTTLACMRVSATSMKLVTGSFATANPATLSFVANPGGGTNFFRLTTGGGTVTPEIGISNAAHFFVYSGTTLTSSVTRSNGTWYALNGLATTSTGGIIDVNGTQTTGTTNTTTATGTATFGEAGDVGPFDMVEGGYWPVGSTGSDLTAIKSNQRAYWNF